MPKTRSGLVPAKIVNENTSEEVNFMFNPKEYSISKTNTWTPTPQSGKSTPELKFGSGAATSLTLELWFDTYPDGTDVRQYTGQLWKMMRPDEGKKDTSGKSEPPHVRFEWGKLKFKAVITSLSQKFLLFDKDGMPLRTQVNITLQQTVDDEEYQSQPGGALVFEAEKIITMSSDLRLDSIAAAISGSSDAMRAVAAANNIEDIKKIANGAALSIPKIPDIPAIPAIPPPPAPPPLPSLPPLPKRPF